MTRSEAISLLKQYTDYNNPDIPDFYTMEEACEVVIKALEQEHCDDCIRRSDMLDAVGHGTTYTSEEVQDIIDGMPSVTPQPCDDAVSRQAVNELVDELARSISDERCCISRGRSTATIMRDIRHLPSVTPQPKMGKWIYHDGYIPYKHECSECGKRFGTDFNYCPMCGAKMSEIPIGAEGSKEE